VLQGNEIIIDFLVYEHKNYFIISDTYFYKRAIRNLKQRLYRYISQNKSLNCIDILLQIIDGINHSTCRVHGMRPIDINFENASIISGNSPALSLSYRFSLYNFPFSMFNPVFVHT